MRRLFPLIAGTACLAWFVGCNSPSDAPARPVPGVTPASVAATPTTAPATGDDVVAILRGNGGALTVHRGELDAALYDAYGLQFLFDVIELDLAKSTLAQVGSTLDQGDIDREQQLVMAKLFQDNPDASAADRETAFDQLLDRQHLTRAEFEIRAVKISACLRKIVEPKTRNTITDEQVHRGFSQMYGEKRQIADIQVANLTDAARVQARLASGEAFGLVAQQMSTDNDTAPAGGEWAQPFSSQSPKNVVPESIKDAAFGMEKIGQVCPDPLSDGKNFHIIKLLKIEAPKLMKYEDVKAEVRKAMEDQIIELKIKALRERLTQTAQAEIEIIQPTLHDKWDKILEAHRPKSVDRDKVLNQIGKDNQQAPSAPGDRPPATMPGAVAPGK